MHILLVTSHLLHGSLLQNALRRHNIKSLACLPKSLGSDWSPHTDAVFFPHALTSHDWQSLRPFLLNLSPKLPFFFWGKHCPPLFQEPPYHGFVKQSVFLDSTLMVDEIPILIKDIVQKSPLYEQGQQVQFGDFILDRQQRRVLFGGVRTLLTKKEFFLLELLLQNAGRVTSREAIIDYVWDRREYVGSNTIEVYVSRLRKKLQIPVTSGLIRTVPCLGYEFSLEGSIH